MRKEERFALLLPFATREIPICKCLCDVRSSPQQRPAPCHEFVNDPIIALANAIRVLSTGKFLDAMRARVRCETVNCFLKGRSYMCGESVQLPLRLRGDENFILHAYRLPDESRFDSLPRDVSLLLCLSDCETRIFKVNAVFQFAQQFDILNGTTATSTLPRRVSTTRSFPYAARLITSENWSRAWAVENVSMLNPLHNGRTYFSSLLCVSVNFR